MSQKLPLKTNPIRELFSLEELVEGTLNRSFPRFAEAKRKAREYLSAEKSASSVNTLCYRADGSIELVRFGPRGGHKTLWAF